MAGSNILDDFEFDDHSLFEEDGSGEVVAKFYSSLEAELAAARLRAAGIPCFLANTASQSVFGNVPMMVRLHVRPAHFEQAQVILAEAAIDAPEPEPSVSRTRSVLAVIGILIGLILLALLYQAVTMPH